MHWCPIHERGFLLASRIPMDPYDAHWRPLSKTLVLYSLTTARVFQCSSQIAIEVTSCDYCVSPAPEYGRDWKRL